MSTVHYLNNEQIPFTALEVTILPPTPPMNPPITVPIPGQTMVPIAAPAVAPAYPPPMLAVLVAAFLQNSPYDIFPLQTFIASGTVCAASMMPPVTMLVLMPFASTFLAV